MHYVIELPGFSADLTDNVSHVNTSLLEYNPLLYQGSYEDALSLIGHFIESLLFALIKVVSDDLEAALIKYLARIADTCLEILTAPVSAAGQA